MNIVRMCVRPCFQVPCKANYQHLPLTFMGFLMLSTGKSEGYNSTWMVSVSLAVCLMQRSTAASCSSSCACPNVLKNFWSWFKNEWVEWVFSSGVHTRTTEEITPQAAIFFLLRLHYFTIKLINWIRHSFIWWYTEQRLTLLSCGFNFFSWCNAQNVGLQCFMWEDGYLLRLQPPVVRNVTHHVCRCHLSPILNIDLQKCII